MKKQIYTLIAAVGLLASSCDSYFDTELYQQIPQENAYANVMDITNNLHGIYYMCGQYRFLGRNTVAIGDMAADIPFLGRVGRQGIGSGQVRHLETVTAVVAVADFVSINTYSVTETEAILNDTWEYGYKVIDLATRNINGAKALLEAGGLSAADQSSLNRAIAQSYALRAHAAFTLVNLFGLPYGTDNSEHGGLIIVEDAPIPETAQVSRASVQSTYEWIIRDITAAQGYPNEISGGVQYYFNPAAIKALEARVLLYMGKYSEAATAAGEALTLRGATEISDKEYVSRWNSTSISNEDIFTIVKSADDNLSANSLNTLYGSYGGTLTKRIFNEVLASTDIRRQLTDTVDGAVYLKKYLGIPGNESVTNIPVFRVSEMHLIQAEAYAMTDNLPAARTALFNTAKRNTAITSENDLPADKKKLLAFIALERQREFFGEGHRWYDARRTGEKISVSDGKFQNYDLSKFVYPIPANEINAGFGTEQNETWKKHLPK